MRTLKLMLRLTIASAFILAPSTAQATFAGGNGRIAYLRQPDGGSRWRGWSIRPDGTGDRPIEGARRGFNYSWSPAGDSLAFLGGVRFRHIATLDTATGTVTRVLGPGAVAADEILWVTFSPDGSQLAFCASFHEPPFERTYVVGIDGGSPTLISGTRRLCVADWSATGRILAVRIASPPDDYALVTMDASGADRQVITLLPSPAAGAGVDPQPSWSPDGTSIVFTLQNTGASTSDVWKVDADGSDMHRIVRTPRRWEWVARYAPDGSKIVVSRSSNRHLFSPGDLWLYDSDGGHPVRLTATRGDEYLQSWRPV